MCKFYGTCLGLLKEACTESFFFRSRGNSAERAASPGDVQQCIKERGALDTLYRVSRRCTFRFERPILTEKIKCDFVWGLAGFTHSECN